MEQTQIPKSIKQKEHHFLTCEREWLFDVLMFVAGFWGAYTYLLRGGVFCNAQTGNVVLFGLAIGSAKWGEALYYLIPISAYIGGATVSELLPEPVRHTLAIRWDTCLIFVEMAVVLALGFLPESSPVQITQIAINFIASMQYNTFRQAEGTPMATTFVTNHIRQVGLGLAEEIRTRGSADKKHRAKWKKHAKILMTFFIGVAVGTVCCHIFLGKAIWGTLIPLGFIFIALLRADLVIEKDLAAQKPLGH